VWTDAENVRMRICDPEQSNFYPWEKGGKPVNREEAMESKIFSEIWAVADFVVFQDPAVHSYLESQEVNILGRQERDADNPIYYC